MKRITGGYILVLKVQGSFNVQVGKLGRFQIQPGLYFYGGSAKRGLASRVERHFQNRKKRYWHIDYLTIHESIEVLEAWCFPGQSEIEHRLTKINKTERNNIIKGFGAGDCKVKCPAHLWYGPQNLQPEDIAQDYYIIKHVSKYKKQRLG